MRQKLKNINNKLLITIFSLTSFLFLFIHLQFSVINYLSVLLLLAEIILASVIIYALLKKREKEIEEIKNTIRNIRDYKINSSNEIHLGNSLKSVEEEMHLMYDHWKNNIENMKKLEQVRTEFLGNVSHELRTPIFSIQGYLETLLNGALEDSKVNKVFVQKAINNTNNLNNLLNDLIDISMIESGQMKMSFRYFNIHEFLKAVIPEFQPLAETKKIILSLHSPNPNLEVFGDKNRIKQVMTNLISNAIKYTEKGAVEIGVIEEGNSALIYVQDTGFGISEEDLPRIFERFYRVDKNRSREMGGTGLGLAIVKHILEAHDSKIFVESKLGLGSKFYFRLKK